jgi:hypothetical protein
MRFMMLMIASGGRAAIFHEAKDDFPACIARAELL